MGLLGDLNRRTLTALATLIMLLTLVAVTAAGCGGHASAKPNSHGSKPTSGSTKSNSKSSSGGSWG